MKLYILPPGVDFPLMEYDNRGRIISVFLRDNKPDIYNFRCIFCGRICFQYSGDIVSIYDGAKIPEEKAILDILCGQCKILFRVGSI